MFSLYKQAINKIFNGIRDPARSAVFLSSVDKRVELRASQHTDPELTVLLPQYLRLSGEHGMVSLCSLGSRYQDLALIVDQLGFHNLLEGRIPKLFLRVREDDITRRCLRRHAGHLCNGLILRLLQITCRQWTFGNSTTVHLWGPDGRKSEDLLWTDTSTLLEDNRCLLDIDFTSLGDAPAATCQV